MPPPNKHTPRCCLLCSTVRCDAHSSAHSSVSPRAAVHAMRHKGQLARMDATQPCAGQREASPAPPHPTLLRTPRPPRRATGTPGGPRRPRWPAHPPRCPARTPRPRPCRSRCTWTPRRSARPCRGASFRAAASPYTARLRAQADARAEIWDDCSDAYNWHAFAGYSASMRA